MEEGNSEERRRERLQLEAEEDEQRRRRRRCLSIFHVGKRGLTNRPSFKFLTSSGDGARVRRKREDLSDALSKNITLILEDLLQDYDKTERPDFKKGTHNSEYRRSPRFPHIPVQFAWEDDKSGTLFLLLLSAGGATKVRINILIRSMGPISEEDMVR